MFRPAVSILEPPVTLCGVFSHSIFRFVPVSSSGLPLVVWASPVPTTSQDVLGGRNDVTSSSTPAFVSNSTISPSSTTIDLQSSQSTSTSEVVLNPRGSNHQGAIIGGTIGGVVMIAILLLLFCCMRRRSCREPTAALYPFTIDSIEGPAAAHACCNHSLEKTGHQHHDGGASEMKQVPPRVDLLEGNPHASEVSSVGPHRSSRSSPPRAIYRNRRRPPPLKLESLVTPNITGPTNSTHMDPPINLNPSGVPVHDM